MANLEQKLQETVAAVRKVSPLVPDVVLTLGSGLGEIGDEVEQRQAVPFAELPHFLRSNVQGHAGNLVLGTLAGRKVCVLQGRYHYYEGHPMDELVYPLRTAFMLGAKTFIVTNAAGGANPAFTPGDLMLITDHINFLGTHPLRGENPASLGGRFYDMCTAYTPELLDVARKVGKEMGIALREGVYCATLGPSYETPAEIRMIRQWGADAVGMSTVPEVLAAAHMGMKTLGISCITNMAAGILPQPLSHQEVIETSQRVKETFKQLIRGVLRTL